MQIFVHADIGLEEVDTASSEASAAYRGVLRLMLRELGAEAAYVGIDEAEPAAGFVSLPLKSNGEHLGWMGWRGGLKTREAALPYREIAADLAHNQRLARRALEAEREVKQERDAYSQDSQSMRVVIDVGGHFTRVSRSFEEMLGYPPGEMLRRPILEFIHPEDHESTLAVLTRIVEGGNCHTFENRYLHADGSVRWLQWSCPPVAAGTGQLYPTARDQSKSKQLEEELQQLALIAQRTNNAVLLTNAEMEIEWVNEAFTRLTGYTLDEVKGRRQREVLEGPATDPAESRRIGERASLGEIVQTEVLNYRKDGSKYWISLELQPIRDGQGKVTGYMALSWDVTARKEIETKLRDGAKRQADAAAMAQLGGWEIDLEKMVPLWSDQVCRIHDVPLGHRPGLEEAIGYYAPAARITITELVNRAIEYGEAWDVELNMVTAKGRKIWVRTTGSPELEDGKCVRLLGSFQDITERRLREQQLRRSEARNRALLAALPDYLVQISADGTILHFHDGDRGSQSFPLCDAVGGKLKDYAPAELWERFESAQGNLALEGSIEVIEYDLYLDEKQHFFEARLTRTQMGDYLLLIRDVTERVEAERASVSYVEDLEMARQELEVEKQRAEAANQAKSQFLAVMSHEIRTPMNAVLGMTRLLVDSGLEGDRREMAETVLRSGETLLEIINDILDFSKIEAGKTDLESIEFDLERTMEDVVELMNSKAQERGVELLYWFDPAAPRVVRGDPGRLRQMALNYVSNAIKFTGDGYVLLRVLAAGPGRVRVEVEDTGNGIAAGKLPLLFQRFSQADSSTTRRFGGTGLGLAIVRELAELMHGGAFAQSVLGQGSTFSFEVGLPAAGEPETEGVPTIPRMILKGAGAASRGFERLRLELERAFVYGDGAPVEFEEDKLPQPLIGSYLLEKLLGKASVREAAIGAKKQQLKHFDGARILLVEDNLTNQKVGMRLLQRLGCRVDIAANGFEAVQMAGHLPYDLIFMDCQMPEMDGFQASRQIRQLGGALKRVAIIALTAAATHDDRIKCLDSGMNEYLTKPVSMEALAAAIERWTALDGKDVQALRLVS